VSQFPLLPVEAVEVVGPHLERDGDMEQIRCMRSHPRSRLSR
jgi:hypothetical protein